MQTHQGHQAHQSGGVSGRPRGEHSVLQSWLWLKQHKKYTTNTPKYLRKDMLYNIWGWKWPSSHFEVFQKIIFSVTRRLSLLLDEGDCQSSVALVIGGWTTANSSEVFHWRLITEFPPLLISLTKVINNRHRPKVLSLEQDISCTLPPLPAEMSGHTVDVVDGKVGNFLIVSTLAKVVACLEYLCYQLVETSWVFLGATLFSRCLSAFWYKWKYKVSKNLCIYNPLNKNSFVFVWAIGVLICSHMWPKRC